MPTFDWANWVQNASIAEKNDLKADFRAVAAENKEQLRWLSDMVQIYRNVKLARGIYESVATFDLAANVNIVDLVPDIPLPEGYLFGGPSSGFSSEQSKDGGKDRFPSLRLTQRTGGASATFTNWPKFAPKLKINASDLAHQLANLDFDLSATVQYKDASGLPLGAAIAERDPKLRAGKLIAFYQDALEKLNNWPAQKIAQRDAVAQAQAEAAARAQWLDREQQQVNAYYDTERERTYKSLGLITDMDLRVTPYIEALKKANEVALAQRESAINARYDQITGLKTVRDQRQALATSEIEIANLLGEMAAIQTKESEQIQAVIKRYGVTATMPVSGPIGSLDFTKDAISKLSPQGQGEVQRLQRANANALALIAGKITAAQARAGSTAKIDSISQDLQDQVDNLHYAASQRSSDALFQAVALARQADLDARTAQNRLDTQARAANQAAMAQTADTVQTLTNAMLKSTGAQVAPMKLLEGIAHAYGAMLSSFFSRVTVQQTMTPVDSGLDQEAKDVADMWSQAKV
jgi:hypothetical protein